MSRPLPDSNWRQSFRRRLLRWFRRHARDLPWRQTCDPYAIWVSEIMLQQTQVATVVPYYVRFLAAFPNVESLALAEEADVLRQWEGLGYYRRARQMCAAAKKIVDEHGGEFPGQPDAVRALPGIGRYTAGAILSIALDAREPILEANTIRLLSRLLAYRGDPRQSAGQRLLWSFATSLLPRKNTGEFNQALMELGSEICQARSPRCDACPVALLCPTRENGWQQLIPRATRKKNYEHVREAAVVVWRGKRLLVRKCGDHERWAGLWDFPRFVIDRRRGDALKRELAEKVAALTGASVEPGARLATIKYGVTRFRITLSCYEATYLCGRLQDERHRWLKPTELGQLPLSVTGRRLCLRVINAQD